MPPGRTSSKRKAVELDEASPTKKAARTTGRKKTAQPKKKIVWHLAAADGKATLCIDAPLEDGNGGGAAEDGEEQEWIPEWNVAAFHQAASLASHVEDVINLNDVFFSNISKAVEEAGGAIVKEVENLRCLRKCCRIRSPQRCTQKTWAEVWRTTKTLHRLSKAAAKHLQLYRKLRRCMRQWLMLNMPMTTEQNPLPRQHPTPAIPLTWGQPFQTSQWVPTWSG
jgi:hypothetical protein